MCEVHKRTLLPKAQIVVYSKLHAAGQAAYTDQAVSAACQSAVAAKQIPLSGALVELKCRWLGDRSGVSRPVLAYTCPLDQCLHDP